MKNIIKMFMSTVAIIGGVCALQTLNSTQATVAQDMDKKSTPTTVAEESIKSDTAAVKNEQSKSEQLLKEEQMLDDFINKNIKNSHDSLFKELKEKGETFAESLKKRLQDEKWQKQLKDQKSQLKRFVDDFALKCELERKIKADIQKAKETITSVKSPKDRIDHCCGIVNAGSSCYFNAAIQQLYRYSDFIKYLNEISKKEKREAWDDQSQTVYYNLMQIFLILDKTESGKSVNINEYINKIRYILSQEQCICDASDATDCINKIFDRLHYSKSDVYDFITIPNCDLENIIEFTMSESPIKANEHKTLLFCNMVEIINGKLSSDPLINISKNITLNGTSKNSTYKLTGIVRWISGHYISYINIKDQWILIDDSKPIVAIPDINSVETIKNSASTILRYERIDV